VGKYRVLIKPSAVKEIENISRKLDRRRIVERIANLANDPRPPGSQKLSGRDRFRLRQSPFRIIYLIQDDVLVVFVVKVGHRKDVYRDDL
jgi:mRNA interferase RelE/StbE